MMNRLITFGIIICFFAFLATSAVAENQVIVDFYYSETCGSCKPANEIMDQIIHHYEENNSDQVIFFKKEITSNTTNRNEMRERGLSYPSVIVNNLTKIPKVNITYETLILVIDQAIANLTPNIFYDQNITEIPFFGKINLSQLTLPFLTITLATLDSFNPCAFFILIVLLSMLLYLQSRKKMLIVGTIFIFFSGLFYALFMLVLFNSFFFTKLYISVTSIIVGIVACIVGIINIKDFFYFKEGFSLSIPEDKREITFKRMRKLVKSPSLLVMIGGTIFIAISVNFFELLCTFGFPLYFTNRLALENLPTLTYYFYILLYTIFYVIPLLIILIFSVFSLGVKKLTDWQGRILKLFPGVFLFSFGIVMIIDYQLLQGNNLLMLFCLVGFDILLTFLIAKIWKQYKENPKKIPLEEHPESIPGNEQEKNRP
jgi:thiol-disulfide isomerase/thioredoxin